MKYAPAVVFVKSHWRQQEAEMERLFEEIIDVAPGDEGNHTESRSGEAPAA